MLEKNVVRHVLPVSKIVSCVSMILALRSPRKIVWRGYVKLWQHAWAWDSCTLLGKDMRCRSEVLRNGSCLMPPYEHEWTGWFNVAISW
jgi:hypothetical protein